MPPRRPYSRFVWYARAARRPSGSSAATRPDTKSLQSGGRRGAGWSMLSAAKPTRSRAPSPGSSPAKPCSNASPTAITASTPKPRSKTHLRILAARFTHERLTATAKSQGALVSDTPEVLFVCVHNAGRSQMAAALLHHHAAGRVTVRSAGSAPAGRINTAVTDAMAEIGIDLSREFPNPHRRSRPSRRRRHRAAETPAPSTPASATSTGTFPTPPANPRPSPPHPRGHRPTRPSATRRTCSRVINPEPTRPRDPRPPLDCFDHGMS